jgi:hypothetical protein
MRTMDKARVEELTEEADELLATDPEHFDAPFYNQRGREWTAAARDLLGEDAPRPHGGLPNTITTIDYEEEEGVT